MLELIATEESYLDDLISVKDEFFPMLRSICTAGEATKLFGNWGELIPLAEELLAALKANPSADALGEVRCSSRTISQHSLATMLYSCSGQNEAFVFICLTRFQPEECYSDSWRCVTSSVR
jgi:hypothetical protein